MLKRYIVPFLNMKVKTKFDLSPMTRLISFLLYKYKFLHWLVIVIYFSLKRNIELFFLNIFIFDYFDVLRVLMFLLCYYRYYFFIFLLVKFVFWCWLLWFVLVSRNVELLL